MIELTPELLGAIATLVYALAALAEARKPKQ